MRLIDADELITHRFLTPLVKVIGGRRGGKTRELTIKAYQKGWNDCIDAIIDNAPTVEETYKEKYDQLKEAYSLLAEAYGHEVTKEDRPQGEWIFDGVYHDSNNPIGSDMYHCSICERSIITTLTKPTVLFPFCHCGADMRGGEAND